MWKKLEYLYAFYQKPQQTTPFLILFNKREKFIFSIFMGKKLTWVLRYAWNISLVTVVLTHNNNEVLALVPSCIKCTCLYAHHLLCTCLYFRYLTCFAVAVDEQPDSVGNAVTTFTQQYNVAPYDRYVLGMWTMKWCLAMYLWCIKELSTQQRRSSWRKKVLKTPIVWLWSWIPQSLLI